MRKPVFVHIIMVLMVGALMFQSCNSDGSQQTIISEQAEDQVQFGQANMSIPPLSKSARDLASSWGAFEDFDVALNEIDGSNIEELVNTTERLITITDSLATNIPDSLNTRPIQSRLIVVSTAVKLVLQEVNKPGADSASVAQRLSGLRESVKELYFHMDEKLQKDAIDLQRIEDEKKELEAQKKFLDSVFQAELADKNEQ